MRIMTWNILHGGRESEPSNLPQLCEVVASARPDVVILVETYGSGEVITRALNDAATPGVQYQGHRITQDDPGRDNLWIVHRFESVHTYLAPEAISTFHFGGLRLRHGETEFDVFACWLNYLPRTRVALEADIAALAAGRPRPYGDGALAELDRSTRDPVNPMPAEPTNRPENSRVSQAERILFQALPALLPGRTGIPTVLAGDFNCLSHQDWSEPNRTLPRHHGIAVRWPVTAAFERAGFRDAFRIAHPDAGRDPGATRLSPGPPYATDYRIDYIWVRGDAEVVGARLIDRRRAEHGPGPFYSDHAALVAELALPGGPTG